MGREIRRVAPDWQHPYDGEGRLVPLLNPSEWTEAERERFGPFMPVWSEDEATAYQVYETVTEGTPMSPVLATREALFEWLTTATEDISGREFVPLSAAGANAFIKAGWVVSGVITEDGLMSGLDELDRNARLRARGWM